MFFAIIFIAGLVVGSFLNVVISRLYTKEKILYSRSHCPYCKKVLAWYDLIPLISFASVKGKCRWCGKKISWQYPLVEFFTGFFFVLVGYLFFGGFLCQSLFYCSIVLLFYCFFISCLIVVFVYDLKHFIIPDKVIYPAIIGGLSFRVFLDLAQASNGAVGQWSNTTRGGLAAGIAAGFFLALVLGSRGKWMGLGDVKLALFMGLILGWPNILVALVLAFVLGATIGIILILAKKKTLKSQIPFGPFLSAATLISIFWADSLINWYLNFIGYY